MLSILDIVNRACLICLCKFTFACRIIDVPPRHGQCKFQDDCIVQMFVKSHVSLNLHGHDLRLFGVAYRGSNLVCHSVTYLSYSTACRVV